MLYFTYFARISNPATIQTPKTFFVTLGTYLPSYIIRIKDQLHQNRAEIKKLWTNIFKHDRYDIVFIRFSFNKNVSRHANDLFFHRLCFWDRHNYWIWDDPRNHQVRIQNGSMGPIMDRPIWTVPYKILKPHHTNKHSENYWNPEREIFTVLWKFGVISSWWR